MSKSFISQILYNTKHLVTGSCGLSFNSATKIGMALLKNGGSALDAVEIALRLMEDREITNAGYGSNLTADGTVECDATIVDHMGRSGAVGACSSESFFPFEKFNEPLLIGSMNLKTSKTPFLLPACSSIVRTSPSLYNEYLRTSS
jgi:hypothetical protein